MAPHWRRWLGVEHRCLVPFTAFAEPDAAKGGNAWFTLRDDRPAFFAGLHVRSWTSVRKLKDGETVAVGWITWPDKATRDAAWEKMMQDERLAGAEMPFDGKRMIFGGFETLIDG